jgi:hypothetical protein
MPATFDPIPLLIMLAQSLPVYIVWLVGAIMALMYRNRYPQVSLLALAGFLLLLVTSVVGTVATFWFIHYQSQSAGWTMSQTSFALAVISFVRIGFTTIGHILLLIGIFGWRFRPIVHPAPLEVSPPSGPRGSDAIQPSV